MYSVDNFKSPNHSKILVSIILKMEYCTFFLVFSRRYLSISKMMIDGCTISELQNIFRQTEQFSEISKKKYGKYSLSIHDHKLWIRLQVSVRHRGWSRQARPWNTRLDYLNAEFFCFIVLFMKNKKYNLNVTLLESWRFLRICLRLIVRAVSRQSSYDVIQSLNENQVE